MSGIYLPGELLVPENCRDCILCAYVPDGDIDWHYECAYLGDKIPKWQAHKEKLEDCPIIPVPDHGRLIDADALRQDWLENGENEYVYDTNAVLDSIDYAPTVIPREEKDE